MKKSNQPDTVDVLGMGIIPLDLLFGINNFPKAGHKIDGTDLCIQGGGPVPNALTGLSRLGRSTALIAVVGHDEFGRISREEICSEGIDDRFIIEKRKPSMVACGWIEKGSGRRTMVLNRKIFVLPKDLTLKQYPIPKVVHLDGRDLEATLKLARWGRRQGAVISFDIGSQRNDVSPILPLVDHLVVADGYAFPFTGTKTARKAIEKLRKHCNGTIVVTEGIKGSTGLENGELVYQSAYVVKAVDTTGAGDAFHTGYIHALLDGKTLSERLHLGAAVAALKCTLPGGRTGMPNRSQLRTFLSKRQRRYV